MIAAGPAALLRRKLRASLRKFAIEIAGPIKNFPGMETALSKWGDLYKLLEKHQRVVRTHIGVLKVSDVVQSDVL